MREYTPIERAAIVADILARGGALTTARVVELTECKERAARGILRKLERVLPITRCDNGEWVRLDRVNTAVAERNTEVE